METKAIKLKIDAKEEIRQMSLEEVYTQFKRYLHSACKSWLGIYDPEDLHQIAFIGLQKAYESYSIEKDILFMTYAARIVSNELLMAHRKNKKHLSISSLNDTFSVKDGEDIEFQEMLASDFNCEEKVVDGILIEIAKEILNSMKERDKTIVIGLIFENKTQKGLAEELNLSQSYISRVYHRTISKIRKKMEVNNNMARKFNSKITEEQLLNECREHGTTRAAAKIIGEKYGLERGTIVNYIMRYKIREVLEKEKSDKLPEGNKEITSDNIKLSSSLNRNPTIRSEDNLKIRECNPSTEPLEEYSRWKDHDGDHPNLNIPSVRARLKTILKGSIGEYDITSKCISAKINGGDVLFDESQLPDLIEELKELDKIMRGR